MRLPRTTARILFPAAALALVAFAGVHQSRAAVASSAPPARIVFPVVGKTTYSDDFGDPRPGGPHQGNDLIAARHTPVVAAEAGTVRLWTRSASAGCMLYLHGRSGTTYLYIHLNNDLGAGNDNRGRCVDGVAYAPGLRDGQKVAAGALIGFVGDSGDANGIHPHLHFELHPGGASATDPFPYLKAAQRLLFSVPPGSVYTLSLAGTVVSTDDGQLTLKVAGLHEWTSGMDAKKVGRTLVLSVPDTAAIQAAPKNGVPGRKLALTAATKGMKAIVWSLPAVATLKAE